MAAGRTALPSVYDTWRIRRLGQCCTGRRFTLISSVCPIGWYADNLDNLVPGRSRLHHGGGGEQLDRYLQVSAH